MRIVDDAIIGRHGEIPVRRYGHGAPRLVWLHGGAFSHGGLDMNESDAVARALADRDLPVSAVDRDSLRASGQSFARELAAAGVATEHVVVPETRHGFLDRLADGAFEIGIDRLAAALA
ncbi:MAG: hypothetical protein ABS62_06980 [Microbacterium sp. SCN 70-200]|nr:MAG: hypothetical protein ABS62_06980 [Microbacterium sp. SCN 70-200]OJV79472.1 MAG: hypothetical protein BGO46_03920 [Microbacterium sp. 70-16]